MTRTVISLESDIKEWLDHRAAQEGVPMTELVRRALRLLQQQETQAVDALLQDTKGIWTNGDGLGYQEQLRTEWSR